MKVKGGERVAISKDHGIKVWSGLGVLEFDHEWMLLVNESGATSKQVLKDIIDFIARMEELRKLVLMPKKLYFQN